MISQVKVVEPILGTAVLAVNLQGFLTSELAAIALPCIESSAGNTTERLAMIAETLTNNVTEYLWDPVHNVLTIDSLGEVIEIVYEFGDDYMACACPKVSPLYSLFLNTSNDRFPEVTGATGRLLDLLFVDLPDLAIVERNVSLPFFLSFATQYNRLVDADAGLVDDFVEAFRLFILGTYSDLTSLPPECTGERDVLTPPPTRERDRRYYGYSPYGGDDADPVYTPQCVGARLNSGALFAENPFLTTRCLDSVVEGLEDFYNATLYAENTTLAPPYPAADIFWIAGFCTEPECPEAGCKYYKSGPDPFAPASPFNHAGCMEKTLDTDLVLCPDDNPAGGTLYNTSISTCGCNGSATCPCECESTGVDRYEEDESLPSECSFTCSSCLTGYDGDDCFSCASGYEECPGPDDVPWPNCLPSLPDLPAEVGFCNACLGNCTCFPPYTGDLCGVCDIGYAFCNGECVVNTTSPPAFCATYNPCNPAICLSCEDDRVIYNDTLLGILCLTPEEACEAQGLNNSCDACTGQGRCTSCIGGLQPCYKNGTAQCLDTDTYCATISGNPFYAACNPCSDELGRCKRNGYGPCFEGGVCVCRENSATTCTPCPDIEGDGFPRITNIRDAHLARTILGNPLKLSGSGVILAVGMLANLPAVNMESWGTPILTFMTDLGLGAIDDTTETGAALLDSFKGETAIIEAGGSAAKVVFLYGRALLHVILQSVEGGAKGVPAHQSCATSWDLGYFKEARDEMYDNTATLAAAAAAQFEADALPTFVKEVVRIAARGLYMASNLIVHFDELTLDPCSEVSLDFDGLLVEAGALAVSFADLVEAIAIDRPKPCSEEPHDLLCTIPLVVSASIQYGIAVARKVAVFLEQDICNDGGADTFDVDVLTGPELVTLNLAITRAITNLILEDYTRVCHPGTKNFNETVARGVAAISMLIIINGAKVVIEIIKTGRRVPGESQEELEERLLSSFTYEILHSSAADIVELADALSCVAGKDPSDVSNPANLLVVLSDILFTGALATKTQLPQLVLDLIGTVTYATSGRKGDLAIAGGKFLDAIRILDTVIVDGFNELLLKLSTFTIVQKLANDVSTTVNKVKSDFNGFKGDVAAAMEALCEGVKGALKKVPLAKIDLSCKSKLKRGWDMYGDAGYTDQAEWREMLDQILGARRQMSEGLEKREGEALRESLLSIAMESTWEGGESECGYFMAKILETNASMPLEAYGGGFKLADCYISDVTGLDLGIPPAVLTDNKVAAKALGMLTMGLYTWYNTPVNASAGAFAEDLRRAGVEAWAIGHIVDARERVHGTQEEPNGERLQRRGFEMPPEAVETRTSEQKFYDVVWERMKERAKAAESTEAQREARATLADIYPPDTAHGKTVRASGIEKFPARSLGAITPTGQCLLLAATAFEADCPVAEQVTNMLVNSMGLIRHFGDHQLPRLGLTDQQLAERFPNDAPSFEWPRPTVSLNPNDSFEFPLSPAPNPSNHRMVEEVAVFAVSSLLYDAAAGAGDVLDYFLDISGLFKCDRSLQLGQCTNETHLGGALIITLGGILVLRMVVGFLGTVTVIANPLKLAFIRGLYIVVFLYAFTGMGLPCSYPVLFGLPPNHISPCVVLSTRQWLEQVFYLPPREFVSVTMEAPDFYVETDSNGLISKGPPCQQMASWTGGAFFVAARGFLPESFTRVIAWAPGQTTHTGGLLPNGLFGFAMVGEASFYEEPQQWSDGTVRICGVILATHATMLLLAEYALLSAIGSLLLSNKAGQIIGAWALGSARFRVAFKDLVDWLETDPATGLRVSETYLTEPEFGLNIA